MKNKKKGKKGTMALKFDMSKSYGKIEWDFFLGSLKAMEFPSPMIHLIKICISFISYQSLINGQPSICFYSERGLRQGHPLSPYLFIIYANVLLGMLKNEELYMGIHGVQVARKSVTISHLFFMMITYYLLERMLMNLIVSSISFQVIKRPPDKWRILTNLRSPSVVMLGKVPKR